MRLKLFALAVAIATLLVGPATAAPIGGLDTGICNTGGGVTVTLTTIDWYLPVGGGDGCIVTGGGTNITHSGGVLTGGVQGLILDLDVVSTPLPLDSFMTFTGTPLNFVLESLGPGVANTNCVGLAVGSSCSVAPGSPFILTRSSRGTTVTLSAQGTVTDDDPGASEWFGAFTTQINNRTPEQIQTNILAGGSESSTHSGEFDLTVIPEPATMAFVGTGLVLLGVVARRRRKV
jgi:hypothetical protein